MKKERLPPWIRVRLSDSETTKKVRGAIAGCGLHTVCESARCPNLHECFNSGTATFMILGDVCTRNCGFCAVRHGSPLPPDPGEPERVAAAAAALELRHVVVTSVTRDDLTDGGAGAFAETVALTRRRVPGASIEVLIPDFKGNHDSLSVVLKSAPDVLNHNLETVRRLQSAVRPAADYERSLGVLRFAAGWGGGVAVKSGLMAGLGETDEEIHGALLDLRNAGCSFVTIGQYLSPSHGHLPVVRYVEPCVFAEYKRLALEMGFRGVAAGPLTRSSHKAGELYRGCRENRSGG